MLGLGMRATGDVNGPGKPGCSASNMGNQPRNKKPLARWNDNNNQLTSQKSLEGSHESMIQEFY